MPTTATSAAATSAAPSGTATPTPTPTPTPTCVDLTEAALTDKQRVGQLLMVGFDTNAARRSLDKTIRATHVGNVIYLGGWYGRTKVKATSRHLQSLVGASSTGDVGLLIAADQEGGVVHQLRGDGFTQPPSAKAQAAMTPDELTAAATGWAKELKAAGINVNLAPVADTVPTSIGTANQPIGRWGRQYGSTPKVVSRSATAFLRGMLAGGVEGTVKHFPGLGRITGNTDFSATGITDRVATVDDPYLQPFADGIRAGAGLVMVSSARYPKLDGKNAAMFSRAIITDLLRGRLGYDGVVITDDVNAAAVRDVPVTQRAVRFLAAGGDIVLTGDPSVAARMSAAVLARAADSPAFAARVDAAVTRVLVLKDRMGLLPCS